LGASPLGQDGNVVATDAGTYVEIQGTAEGRAFHRGELDRLLTLADDGIARLFSLQAEALARGSEAGTQPGS